MITKSRSVMITVIVFVVFVFSAIWTVPAYADDSTPPPVETPTEVVPPVDQGVVEVLPAESTEPAMIVDEPVLVEPEVPSALVDESVSAEPVALVELLDQLPEGTEVQVVDENGEALPLVTQDAADTVATSDPIWCPSTVLTPLNGAGGCSPSYTSFNDLLNWLTLNNPAKAGTIWIEKTYDSSTAVGTITDVGETSFTLDGLTLTNMANFALTIKGGWNGIGTKTIDMNDPSVFTGASLSIINWKANVTLSDIMIFGATSNTGVDDNALLVETDASTVTTNIQLDRVTVLDGENTGAGDMTGATLDNSSSTKASTVVINNGVFQNNEGDGLRVFSAGVVTITSLIADANDVGGAVIDNTFAITDKAVTLKGAQEYNYNGSGAGLIVFSDGLITISNVVANSNGGTGVDLDNTTSLTNQGVTISGTNNFLDNGIGLNVLSHGVISANNINASDNGDVGASLDNCDDVGGCAVSAAKLVKLTGYNYFFNNTADGLQIVSFGAITVSNVTASDNGGNGVYLDNQWSSSITNKESSGGITQTGYGVFNNNNGDGLLLFSHLHAALANLTANNNGFSGVNIDVDRLTAVVINKVSVSAANVTLTGLNNFIQNSDDGLLISADGKITLASVVASFNGDDGADLLTTTAGSAVTLTGTNTFTQNVDAGLLVNSAGAISASNVVSTFNQYGAQLFNNKNTAKQYNVTLSGTNTFNFNDADGLDVHSYGVISVNNLTANANGLVASSGNGATLDSCNAPDYSGTPACVTTTAKAVTLTGYVNVSDNYFRGLQIYNLGAVTLSNAFANNNGNVGVHINNQLKPTISASIVRTVTLKGTNTFNYNGSSGLFIRSFGAITLNNINAYGNFGDAGAALFNNVAGSSYAVKNITITGVNSFIKNDAYGLYFSSDGAVSLTRINADGNNPTLGGLPGGGLVGSAKTITLTCGHMYDNGANDVISTGYNLTATGALTIKGIYSASNGAADVANGSVVTITKACALP